MIRTKIGVNARLISRFAAFPEKIENIDRRMVDIIRTSSLFQQRPFVRRLPINTSKAVSVENLETGSGSDDDIQGVVRFRTATRIMSSVSFRARRLRVFPTVVRRTRPDLLHHRRDHTLDERERPSRVLSASRPPVMALRESRFRLFRLSRRWRSFLAHRSARVDRTLVSSVPRRTRIRDEIETERDR